MIKFKMPQAARTFKRCRYAWHTLIFFWLGYNTYFGWNTEPINVAERFCDLIFGIGTMTTLFFYIKPIFAWFENQAITHEIMQELASRTKCDDPNCENCKDK